MAIQFTSSDYLHK
uniref:Uncharacterized protein n=1 Tax=Anguilla anguilla TaxID=7936 RepID=A0A0E9U7X6_ANGAN